MRGKKEKIRIQWKNVNRGTVALGWTVHKKKSMRERQRENTGFSRFLTLQESKEESGEFLKERKTEKESSPAFLFKWWKVHL